uniref:Immunoglobulin-like and fibronectin type III domain-containing protein 1 n=1 Tax=Kryptolebias marmoratus TaxID=37003 RepID=A0A3Q3AD20_KRYMA
TRAQRMKQRPPAEGEKGIFFLIYISSSAIRRRSKTPGVMITQYTIRLPEGKSTPDFQCKPAPVTTQEGKLAVFKAVVTGNPKPDVSWRRTRGNLSDKDKFKQNYNESTGEYILEIHKVTAAETDTYKCYAVNEFGKAVCSTTLGVLDGKIYYLNLLFSGSTNPEDFRKMLRKSKVEKANGDNNEKFWDAMLNADRRDYERICSEYEVTDLQLILKKLEEKRTARAQNRNKVRKLTAPTQDGLFSVKSNDGVIPCDVDAEEHGVRSAGRTNGNRINRLLQNDSGLHLGDVEEVNLLSNVDFVIKIQEIKAEERDDALFECVLTHPLPKITWMKKGIALEDGEKYSITVSTDRLIHKLLIKDCSKTDKGIYSAIAGITSCSAWLVVEAKKNPASGGTKAVRKTALAGGAQTDLEKVAKEQQMKNQQEMEKILKAVKAKHAAGKTKEEVSSHSGGDLRESERKEKAQSKNSEDGAATNLDDLDGVGGSSGQAGLQVHPPEEKTMELDPARQSRSEPKGWQSTGERISNNVCSDVWRLFPDPGVQFVCGLSDVDAIISEMAELTCKLSSEDCEGLAIDGPIHKLVIVKCIEEYSGKYRFEADGRKTEAMVNVKDPPRFDSEGLCAFTEPLTVKVGHHAIFKLQFVGYKPIKIQWYRDGEELQEDNNTKIEKSSSHSRLLLSRCQRKDTGEIKIKLKNDHGFTEAVSQLIVLDKPTPPLGPAEVMESSASCIEFKWRPPKDDGGSPVTNYILERQQVGRNTWKKIGELPAVPKHRDTDVDRGRKYCYRIRAVTSEGTSEVMETDEMQAGKFAFPGPPAPPKVVSAFNDCINLSWVSPANSGGSRILGYILEKRKKGSNLWTVVNASDEIIKEKKYAVKDVVEGIEYEFRVSAINLSGAGEFSNPSEFVFARDPKKPPGKVTSLKVTETSYTNMVVTWTKPEDKPGEQDEAKGYFVEIRQADCTEWSRCNSTPIIMTSFNVKSLKSMDMYWVRVIAMNDGGESATEELPRYVLAMPLPVRPKFTNKKMKSFMVVRAGNSVRITVNFEASPRPEVTWLKDNVPLTKRVTISNSDGSSQLLIPTSERSDSGIYSILVKNFAGQETFSTEVRVTDDPKPPGPVELEESVPGTVTVIWKPSPDEKRDDRLHYTVSKLDSTKHTWITVADRLFNNKFTVCNIMQGREYHFRVYAKNDMGISAPSESPTWGMEKKKDKFVISEPTNKDCDLRCAPAFIVPLKLQTATAGYECLMSCAVKGNPTPRITWYRNHVSLNTDTNFYISNVFGVCSLKILRVGPKDMAEYTVIAENSQGRAECSTVLNIRGERGTRLHLHHKKEQRLRGIHLFFCLSPMQSEETWHLWLKVIYLIQGL